jgi:hypothetical protein
MKRLNVLVLVGSFWVLLAGCGGSSHLGGPAAPIVHQAALDRGSVATATLDVASGAMAVHITVADLPGKLLAVTTPPRSGEEPLLATGSGGVVNLRLAAATPAGGPSLVDVVLDRSVLWRIDLGGGATDETVDMRGGHVGLIELAGGATNETIELPAAAGTEVVRELGGASNVTVAVPTTVATRVDVHGGAGSVLIGSITHTGIGGDQSFQDPAYSTAADRLDLDLRGGVSRVQVKKS